MLLMNRTHKKREEFVNGILRNCDKDEKKEIIQRQKSDNRNNGKRSKGTEK